MPGVFPSSLLTHFISISSPYDDHQPPLKSWIFSIDYSLVILSLVVALVNQRRRIQIMHFSRQALTQTLWKYRVYISWGKNLILDAVSGLVNWQGWTVPPDHSPPPSHCHILVLVEGYREINEQCWLKFVVIPCHCDTAVQDVTSVHG